MLQIIIRLGLVIFFADTMAGMVHWLEDAYGNPNWKYLGKSVIIPNLEHHQYPRNMTKNGYWDTVKYSFAIGLILVFVFWILGILNVYSLLTIFIAANGNETHKWAHQTEKENGKIITWLQKHKILISRQHHGLHHRSPYIGKYCTITNFVNPVLDFLHFWNTLEFLLLILGIKVMRGSPARMGL